MRHTGLISGATLIALGIACSDPVEATGWRRPSPPDRPADAIEIPAGSDLQASLAAAPDHAVFALAPGTHRGPLTVDRPLLVWGPTDAIVSSNGRGSTIDVTSDRVALLGFTVDGSGGRFDLTDAAVRVRADDVRVEGLTIRRALFGILVEKARRVEVRGNRIEGDPEKPLGLRGDGVRLWETEDSAVTANSIRDSRDLVVWYSSNNLIADNRVRGCRYGTHFMYSHDNVVEGNRYLENVVSVFVMYSRGIALRGNVLALSDGAAGLGLGLKESGNLEVSGNLFVQNGVGIHSDNSPLDRDDHNRFEHNLFSSCGTAVVFNGIAQRSLFEANVFRHNLTQVRVDGGADAMGVGWSGNDFDDYRGYDLDGDGIGDVPYELRRLSSELTGRHPQLAFFRGSPTLALIDMSSHVMPLFQPRTILVDARPAMSGEISEVRDAR